MSKWYSVCTECGMGGPLDEVSTDECDHLVWTFLKDCEVKEFSSRACEIGTKGCETRHGKKES